MTLEHTTVADAALPAGRPDRQQPRERRKPKRKPWAKVREAQFCGARRASLSRRAGHIPDSPKSAEDAGRWCPPDSIHAVAAQHPERWIRKIDLVIDKNPSAVGAVFHLDARLRATDIETRIRSRITRGYARSRDADGTLTWQ